MRFISVSNNFCKACKNSSEVQKHTYSSNFITEFLQYRYYDFLSFKEAKEERGRKQTSLFRTDHLVVYWQGPLQPEQLPEQENSSLCRARNLARRTFFMVNEPRKTITAKAIR